MNRHVALIVFLSMVLVLLGFISSAYGEASRPQDITLTFVNNVLPVDLSKYTLTLTKFTDMNYTSDIVKYSLSSETSELELVCYVKSDVLTGCNVYVKRGIMLTDRVYNNLTDSAIGFLERYQSFTELDSTEMINMLANADLTKNSTVTVGNFELAVQKTQISGVEITGFSWTYVLEGVRYTSLKLGFRNGIFDALTDNRALYTIGETIVKISKEQAIDAAMSYLETYSYAMPDGSQVSGFNVAKENTTAELRCAIRNSTLLYPMWNVNLFLTQTYPGSVDAFSIGVWADSGEVFTIGHEGPGGGIPIMNADLTSTKDVVEPFPMAFIASTFVAVALVVAAATVVYLKKHNHRVEIA